MLSLIRPDETLGARRRHESGDLILTIISLLALITVPLLSAETGTRS